MIKENRNIDRNNLITYNKVGYGKVGIVNYLFNIDKDYNARICMSLDKEVSSTKYLSDNVKLNEDERVILNKFIVNYVNLEKKKLPLFHDNEVDRFEKEEIFYDNLIIDNYDLIDRFNSIIDFIQSNHEEISSDTISNHYNKMCDNIYNKGCSKR